MPDEVSNVIINFFKLTPLNMSLTSNQRTQALPNQPNTNNHQLVYRIHNYFNINFYKPLAIRIEKQE